MTRDDVTRMAYEACEPGTSDAYMNDYWTLTQKELERFARLVAAHEREQCAKACESVADKPSSLWSETGCWAHAAEVCATVIRARGEA